ncbi:L,D-transpeptidase family protein [Gallaecimonas pentaromativorans]|uniref:L,D-transpeptidase family protein n=1 Tax=Gallaecimonas pentaromativorans TaxID=584787 RepID=UPI003A948BC5
MELHFYPGQNLLVVLKSNKPVAKFEAMGGPEKIGEDPRMAEEPTWPGKYIIEKVEAYRTPTWRYSKLAWGTKLKPTPGKTDVWYQLKSGKWGSLNQLFGLNDTQSLVKSLNKQYYGKSEIPATWLFNDFGPLAIRWFKDINGNGILDGKETLSGQMFHTTPENEAEKETGNPVRLVHSHGCIHLKPNDRDRMMAIGAFKKGTIFTVHKYHERY